jgi:catechol 2,3-dioxygenase-like lactoylglutathione lyase family enzyme
MTGQPPAGIVLAHFIVSDDVERSRRFYTEVLGGRVAFSGPGGLTYVALANSWIIINSGGGPTDDKPTVTLQTPHDPDHVSSFLNIRVKDIATVYAEWSARGAQFLTPPKQHQYEIRCYIRDPDGHLIEVGQTTDPDGDWSPAHWPASTPAEESELRPGLLLARRRPDLMAGPLIAAFGVAPLLVFADQSWGATFKAFAYLTNCYGKGLIRRQCGHRSRVRGNTDNWPSGMLDPHN